MHCVRNTTDGGECVFSSQEEKGDDDNEETKSGDEVDAKKAFYVFSLSMFFRFDMCICSLSYMNWYVYI